MVKINKHITFEKVLNIKQFTVDKNNSDIPSEYYDYDLQGILIHSGTAQYGHYYSLIKTGQNEDDEYWFKFNDSKVSRVDFDEILNDAYGRNERAYIGSSAYMLIYQKRNKKPVIINAKELDDKIKKILEEKKEEKLEDIKLDDGNIYYIYENEKDAIEKNDDIQNIKNKENKIDKNIIIKNSEIHAELVSNEDAINLIKKEKNKKTFL